jgi:hypothetical protein
MTTKMKYKKWRDVWKGLSYASNQQSYPARACRSASFQSEGQQTVKEKKNERDKNKTFMHHHNKLAEKVSSAQGK